MREIKFRAWDKKDKYMIQTSGCSNEFIFDGDGLTRVDVPWIDGFTRTSIDSSRLVLMQFTGLHDKNEKEIYEGDIVETGNNSENSEIAKVEFYKGFFIANFDIFYESYEDFECLCDCVFEVIGNIYENPELLND